MYITLFFGRTQTTTYDKTINATNLKYCSQKPTQPPNLQLLHTKSSDIRKIFGKSLRKRQANIYRAKSDDLPTGLSRQKTKNKQINTYTCTYNAFALYGSTRSARLFCRKNIYLHVYVHIWNILLCQQCESIHLNSYQTSHRCLSL